MFRIKKLFFVACLIVGVGFQCHADVVGPKLAPIENNRLRIFEVLYPKDLSNMDQKKKFLKMNFKATEHYDLYTFPKKNIEEVYNAYVWAYPKDSFGASVLHKELPKTSKAFKAGRDDERPGYVLMYVWNDSKHLTITKSTIHDDDNLCGREILEFEEKGNATTLKSFFEQYCFDK